ncbi:MAG: competence protein, partial [Pseudomonadota bacterium]
KPVGTVVFARATRNADGDPEGELKQFGEGTRAEIRHQATICALDLLLP